MTEYEEDRLDFFKSKLFEINDEIKYWSEHMETEDDRLWVEKHRKMSNFYNDVINMLTGVEINPQNQEIIKGSKVLIRTDLLENTKYGMDVFVKDMEKYKGYTLTVNNICFTEKGYENINKVKIFTCNESGYFHWTPEMVERIII